MGFRLVIWTFCAFLMGCDARLDGVQPARFERLVVVSDALFDEGGQIEVSSSAQTRVIKFQSATSREVQVKLSCNQPARLEVAAAVAHADTFIGTAPVPVTVPGRYDPALRLEIGKGATTCTLLQAARAVAIVAETRRPEPSSPCPEMGGKDALSRAFLAPRALAQTCAAAPGDVRVLDDELGALAFRIEALSGQPFEAARLIGARPDMAIDMARAPFFDDIVVSYLHMRADLSGALMVRLLEHHAARGTRIRLLATDALMLDKDRRFYEAFAARHARVELQYYIAEPRPNARVLSHLDQIHRANHAKIFAGVSHRPGASFAIIGGRNLHDGYFFAEAQDLSGFPQLRDYTSEPGGALSGLDIFEDYEVSISSPKAVKALVSQFDAFWHRDRAGQGFANVTSTVPAGGVRHVLSVPMEDGRALEAYFVDLIDAAEHEVVIAAPFFYPPVALDAALLRARARGVNVRLISRLLSGEVHARFTVALNRAYLASRDEVFNVDSYQPDVRVLHSKLMVIDRRLAMVGSINMNPRSFEHDTENALVFLDHPVVGELMTTLDRYTVDGARLAWVPKTGLSELLRQFPWLHRFF